MNQIQSTMLEQINAKVFQIFGCKVMLGHQMEIILHKTHKTFKLSYNEGSDDYQIVMYTFDKEFNITSFEKETGIYCDQLQDIAADFFGVPFAEVTQ